MMIGIWRVRSSWRSWSERHARHARQHPVDQQQVGQRGPDDAEGAFGVPGADHVVSGVLQVNRDQLLDSGLVFDQQDVGGHVASLRTRCDSFVATSKSIVCAHAGSRFSH